jgi:4-hydroxy-tetrahydrodipicolinate synthase
MPDDEHKSVIRFAVEKVANRVPVIAGTGSNDTRHAIELSRFAEKVGSDAILTVTPYYNKTTQKGLYEHFKAIAASISIPVILYNVPSRTNLNINPDTIKALSEVDNIAAVKECNLAQVGDIINLCGDDFTVYSGNDDQIQPIMSLGGQGVISVLANILPKYTHDLVMEYINGDPAIACSMQLRVLPLVSALFCEVNPIPVKTALRLMGYDMGELRLPLCDMEPAHLAVLKEQLSAFSLI